MIYLCGFRQTLLVNWKYDAPIPTPEVGISKRTFFSLTNCARKHCLSPMSPNLLKDIFLTKPILFFQNFPIDSSLDCVQIELPHLAMSTLKKCCSFLKIFNILKTSIVFPIWISNSAVVCLQCFNLKREETFRAFEIDILKPWTKDPNCRQ